MDAAFTVYTTTDFTIHIEAVKSTDILATANRAAARHLDKEGNPGRVTRIVFDYVIQDRKYV